MKQKRIIAICIVVLGIIMLLFSENIATRVAEGRAQISSGQSQVDTANKVFSVHPYSEKVGGVFTGSAQKRIDAGTQEANYYENMGRMVQIAGIVMIVIGGFVFFKSRKKG
jgi:hypothetical protein